MAIMRALIARGYDVTLPTSVSVSVAALILGKSVLIANMLAFINRFPQKPLARGATEHSLANVPLTCTAEANAPDPYTSDAVSARPVGPPWR